MTKKITELDTKSKSKKEPIDYERETKIHLAIQHELAKVSRILKAATERKKNEDQRNNS